MTHNQKEILLIGPSPLPWGGARISFQLFYNYLQTHSDKPVKYLDIPVRKNREGTPPGSVDHKKTLQIVIQNLKMIPHVEFVTIFGSRGFCFSYGLILLVVSKLFGKACCFRFFGGRPMLEFANRPKIMAKVILRLLAFADVISLETKIGAAEFPKRVRDKTIVIPGYRSRLEEKVTPERSIATRFVYVGGIISIKGITILADAFSSLTTPDIELHLFGTGDPEIIARLQQMPGVVLHGKIENQELRHLLPSFDAFVFPTMYENEGHPGVLIEAFMAGLPIITTNMPGINEMVQDKENGIIVPPGDTLRLAEAMRQLAVDDKIKVKLSAGAIRASDQYDAQIVLPHLMRIIGW